MPTLFGVGLAEGKLPFGEIGTSEFSLVGLTPGPGANGRVIFNLAPNYKNNYSIQASFSIARRLRKIFHSKSDICFIAACICSFRKKRIIEKRSAGEPDPTYGP